MAGSRAASCAVEAQEPSGRGLKRRGLRCWPDHPPSNRQLLSVQPEDAKRWLTTSQMGWALTREENELVNEKDEREGKPVARQLAPMISKFIRAQWESKEMENVDDERRQLLEEAMELDHIWGCLGGGERAD